MNAEQLAEVRRWAERLGEAPRPELRAAARAIELLADEVERLQRELSSRDEREREARQDEQARQERERRERERRERERAEREARRERRRRPREREPDERRLEVSARVTPARPPRAQARAERSSPRLPLAPPRGAVRLPPIRLPPGAGRLVLAVAALAALVLAGFAFAGRVAAPDVEIAGPPGDARVGAAAAKKLVFSVRGTPDEIARARWHLDGERVTRLVRREGGTSTFIGNALPDGRHRVSVTVDGSFPGATSSHEWRFEIDRTGPRIAVDPKSIKAPPVLPMRLTGAVETAATLRVAGREVQVRDGRFAVRFATPPAAPVKLAATDSFGNTSTRTVRIRLVPRRPRAPIRAVHVTSHAWASPPLRKGVLDLVERGRINAVELDLKDESGIVGFGPRMPFGRAIGSVQKIYDLRKAVELLHRRGVHVIGRIVAFRDPVHAASAWKRGWRDQVVQTPGGSPYAGYGGFTNFASPAVRRYNIDVARAAAEAGIDDILYDYIRRPDGPLSTMRFPGLVGTPERSIASFLGEARRALRPYRVFLGASVFGVAATRPLEIAQDIGAMARNADYIAPMLYPSHWAPGEYGVANPNSQPYDIILRSLKDFSNEVDGTGARVVPWLQDFSLGVAYGPHEVRAQITAARDAGIREWILWDPLVTYTEDALEPHRRLPPLPTRARRARAAAPAPSAHTARRARERPAAVRVRANELGEIPVLMYHQIRADGGDYDLTPAQFRAELERLYREGYRPVRAVDLVDGTLDVPAGKTPVVLTFDDSTKEQFALLPNGKPKPDTAIAIMLEFAERHPDFKPAGTFYVNREPFAGVPEGAAMLRWLARNGFELGNHTRDHVPFSGMSATEVQRQLVLGKRIIVNAVPGAHVRTLALPLGAVPKPAALARRGRWGGASYRHDGVFLVGAAPARSPFSRAFDPYAIPRIRTSPRGDANGEFGSTYWLDELRRNPERRYVSDGDPRTISFPAQRARELAPRFRKRARPY